MILHQGFWTGSGCQGRFGGRRGPDTHMMGLTAGGNDRLGLSVREPNGRTFSSCGVRDRRSMVWNPDMDKRLAFQPGHSTPLTTFSESGNQGVKRIVRGIRIDAGVPSTDCRENGCGVGPHNGLGRSRAAPIYNSPRYLQIHRSSRRSLHGLLETARRAARGMTP